MVYLFYDQSICIKIIHEGKMIIGLFTNEIHRLLCPLAYYPSNK